MAEKSETGFRVLRLDEDSYWRDIPGFGPWPTPHEAILHATSYYEKTHLHVGVFSPDPKPIWDSSVSLPHFAGKI